LKLLQAINSNDSLAVLQQCRSLLDRGREPLVVLQNLAAFYLNLLIAKTAPQHAELTAVTETCWQELCTEGKNWQTALILRGQQHLKEAETQLKRTTQPRLWLEVTLLGLLPAAHSAITTKVETVVPTSPQQIVTPLPTVVIAPSAPSPNTPPQDSKAVSVTPPAASVNHVATVNSPPQASPAPQAAQLQAVQPQVVQPISESQSASVPQAFPTATPEPVASGTNQDPVANQQLWNQVVSCLHPPTTQALLKQQCHLVNFDGTSAIVGVSSAKLEKMTQQKIPNIEAAFAQVCQRKVRVQLEVASSKKNTTSNSLNTTASTNQKITETHSDIPQQSFSPPPWTSPQNPAVQPIEKTAIPISNVSTQVEAPAKPTSNPVSAKSFNHSSHQHASEAVASPHIPVFTPAVVPETTPTENNIVLADSSLNPEKLASDRDYADSDLKQAIDSLTQSFEGEVVQLEN
ncbi:MAG: hypothetical protein AAGJ80_10555, partial [Cyanobacteria bacterium J06553_1]